MSFLFASLLFLIEEVQTIFIFYKDCKLIQALRKKHDQYSNLSVEERKAVRVYFSAKIRLLDRAQKFICRESSIQVVLQLTLIVYQTNIQNLSKSLTFSGIFKGPKNNLREFDFFRF